MYCICAPSCMSASPSVSSLGRPTGSRRRRPPSAARRISRGDDIPSGMLFSTDPGETVRSPALRRPPTGASSRCSQALSAPPPGLPSHSTPAARPAPAAQQLASSCMVSAEAAHRSISTPSARGGSSRLGTEYGSRHCVEQGNGGSDSQVVPHTLPSFSSYRRPSSSGGFMPHDGGCMPSNMVYSFSDARRPHSARETRAQALL